MFLDTVKELCDTKKITVNKLEEELHFSQGSISKMRGSIPKSDRLFAIAKYFDVPMEIFLDDEIKDEHLKSLTRRDKPLYRAAAGQGAYNDVYADEIISIDDTDSGYEFIEVVGDSMYPVLHDGDIVKVKLTTETEPHDLSVVKVDGESSTIKYCELVSDGLWLKAENKDVFKDKFYSVQEVVTLPISIIGKVVELRRKI